MCEDRQTASVSVTLLRAKKLHVVTITTTCNNILIWNPLCDIAIRLFIGSKSNGLFPLFTMISPEISESGRINCQGRCKFFAFVILVAFWYATSVVNLKIIYSNLMKIYAAFFNVIETCDMTEHMSLCSVFFFLK